MIINIQKTLLVCAISLSIITLFTDSQTSPLFTYPTEPAVPLSRGNVRGQIYVDAKAPVTLGHRKGHHHGDSWVISSLRRHSWVTAPNPPCGINIIFWFLALLCVKKRSVCIVNFNFFYFSCARYNVKMKKVKYKHGGIIISCNFSKFCKLYIVLGETDFILILMTEAFAPFINPSQPHVCSCHIEFPVNTSCHLEETTHVTLLGVITRKTLAFFPLESIMS